MQLLSEMRCLSGAEMAQGGRQGFLARVLAYDHVRDGSDTSKIELTGDGSFSCVAMYPLFPLKTPESECRW